MRLFDVTIPKREPARGFLLPPLFLEGSGAWAEVALRNGANTGLPIRLEVGGSTIVPRTRVEIRPGRRERVVLVAWEPEATRDPAADIDIRSVLTDDGGRTFPPGLVSLESVARGEGGRRSYLLGLTLGDVPPGDYTLRVHIGEADSVLRSYSRIRVLPRETASSDR